MEQNLKRYSKSESYQKRSIWLFTFISMTFVVEMISTICHSGIMAFHSETISMYQKEAMLQCDKNSVIPGDIFDRNDTILVSHNAPISKDRGNYIDTEMYSTILGYHSNSSSSMWLLQKYDDLLRQTPKLDDTKGNSIKLTLEHKLQTKTYHVLKELAGIHGRASAVVMDAESGAILSMVSLPTFNVSDLNNEMKWMLDDKKSGGVWYPFAFNGKETPPGSTFKILSAMTLLENGYEKHTELDNAFTTAGGYTIHNYYKNTDKHIGYAEALKISSNIFFSKSFISIPKGKEKLTQMAKKFYIGEELICDFGKLTGTWTMDKSVLAALQKNAGTKGFDMEYALGASAFGQADVRVSATQMAMIVSAVINGGNLVYPYMVKEVIDCNGTVLDLDNLQIEGLTNTHEQTQVVSKKTAQKICKALQEAAQTYGFSPVLQVAAKSGTAQTGINGNAGNVCWMVSSAKFHGQKYAIVINCTGVAGIVAGKQLRKPIEQIYQFLFSAE